MIVDLYIEGVKADLDADVSITVVDSIQDAKEPDKVMAAFTKEFILPGSKTNNQIFNYWHNPDVQQSFDARYKASAEIKVSGSTYKEGTIRLNGADIQNGVVVGYRVVFLENIVNLRDLLGDDKLETLDFSALDHEYTEANVRTYLMGSLGSGALRYPLIYHTTRYFWTTQFEDAGGNALDYTELKPAVRCYDILDAVATKYGITWDSTSFWYDFDFEDIYLWCHRYAGQMVGGAGEQQVTVPWSEWNFSSGTDVTPMTMGGTLDDPGDFYDITFTITPNDSSLYNVTIIDENEGIGFQTWTNQTGTTAFTALSVSTFSTHTLEPALKVWTDNGIASFSVTLSITKNTGLPSEATGSYTTTTATFSVLSTIVVSNQMPDMKIIDFITSLFKMFNLTAYYTEAGEILVEPLDDFYARGTSWDLTEYIFSDNANVDRVVPYSQIEYKYEPGATFLVEEWNARFGTSSSLNGTNDNYGDVTYRDAFNKWDGESYEVNVGFELMLYERQYATSGVATTISSGWAVDKDQEATIGAPHIMYIVQTSNATHSIRWAGGAAVSNTNYNRPTNSKGAKSITFNAEIDEYNLTTPDGSLFETYHKSYIQQVFNRYTRTFTFRARPSLAFITQYKLYDTIIINNREYRINSIKVNLQTQLAELELINIYDYA